MGTQDEWDWLRKQFDGLLPADRTTWLVKLTFALSMCARAKYGSVSGSIADPQGLRRFNELLHRVAAYNLALLEGNPQRLPDKVLIDLVVEELAALGADAPALASMMPTRSTNAVHEMTIRVDLSDRDLMIINNALNEVCHGIAIFEFQARMGATREEVAKLLGDLGRALERVAPARR